MLFANEGTWNTKFLKKTAPWRREWHPTPVFLPGEFHGQRGLAGCRPWGCKEWHMTEQLTWGRQLSCGGQRGKWGCGMRWAGSDQNRANWYFDKGFCIYPESNRKTLKEVKQGSGMIKISFRKSCFGLVWKIDSQQIHSQSECGQRS